MKIQTTLFNLLLALNFSNQAIASESTDKKFESELKVNKLANIDEQSYCYTNPETNKLEGKNTNMKIRLASVSKLVTSLWAMDALGGDYRFNTKLYINGKNLHIAGSWDPFFGDEKAFYLISQLNELGFNQFDSITFDKNLIVFPGAQVHSNEYPILNKDIIKKYLAQYFNTQNWSGIYKEEYKRISSLSKAGKFLPMVQFSAPNISFAEINPLENQAETRELTLTSPPLHKYIKEINIKSNNYASHTLFRFLGGEKELTKYLSEKHNVVDGETHFYTGSGLPSVLNGVRRDNFSTCQTMVDLISELKNSAKNSQLELEDIVAVPGSDAGTFRNRIISSDIKNAVVAKTGTLMHTSTLAGAMNTQKGYSFFGVFNHTSNILAAKNVQNNMVISIMKDLGGPKAFNYSYSGFHTYNPNEQVKSLEEILDIDEERSDFLPIDGQLF